MQDSNYKYYNIEVIVPAIIEVSNVFSSVGIEHWLDAGALLGLVRENRLLLWDDDVEMTCRWEENRTERAFLDAAERLAELGYEVYYLSAVGALSVKKDDVDITLDGLYPIEGSLCRPLPMALHHPSNFLCHWVYLFSVLFTYVPTNFGSGYTRNVRSLIKYVAISIARLFPRKFRRALFLRGIRVSNRLGGEVLVGKIPCGHLDHLEEVSFYNSTIHIPKNARQYLALLYGKGWETPKEDWHFHDPELADESGIKYDKHPWPYENAPII